MKKKNQILTIPNLLSLLRLAMIPLLLWLYLEKEAYLWTAAVVVLSGATDIGSGIAAGVISAAAAISHGITKKLASTAMDRSVPKVCEKFAAAVTETDYHLESSRVRTDAAKRLLEKYENATQKIWADFDGQCS